MREDPTDLTHHEPRGTSLIAIHRARKKLHVNQSNAVKRDEFQICIIIIML